MFEEVLDKLAYRPDRKPLAHLNSLPPKDQEQIKSLDKINLPKSNGGEDFVFEREKISEFAPTNHDFKSQNWGRVHTGPQNPDDLAPELRSQYEDLRRERILEAAIKGNRNAEFQFGDAPQTEEKKNLLNELSGAGSWMNNNKGNILQVAGMIPGMLQAFRGTDQETLRKETPRQIDHTPIVDKITQGFTAQMQQMDGSTYNSSQAMRQNAHNNYQNTLKDVMMNISQQNKQLGQQTERFNIGQADRYDDLMARNRAATRDMRRNVGAQISNIGAGVNQQRAARESMGMLGEMYDVSKYFEGMNPYLNN